ncbi:fluoride efflux transporter CrcB [Mycolicibacterium phlei]|jgi:CrcB protein
MIMWVGIALCGGLGAVLRFLVDRTVSHRLPGLFPTGIFVVNVSGAFVLGLLGALALGPTTSALAGVAFVGAFTTFSTWMTQTLELRDGGRTTLAVLNIVASLIFGLAAAALGHWLGGRL